MFVEKRVSQLAKRFVDSTPVPLRLQLWNGVAYDLGPLPSVTVTLKEPAALKALFNADFSNLGEAYIHEKIDVDGCIADAIRAAEVLIRGSRPRSGVWARLGKAVRHTRRQDAAAIEHHYDVSNEFYRLWLDDNLAYSCAYFKSDSATLDQAQIDKFDHVCRKLQLQPGERFLDIGCGWGGLVSHAVRRYGVHAVGITLSRNQYDYAKERIAREGLAARCRIEFLDYRDLPEQVKFDKIASIGMFEHVGLSNLPLYFAKVERLLDDQGMVMNHGITTMDPRNRAVGMGAGAFIDRHIFPHGELPHLSLAIRCMSESGLEAIDVESLRHHYARTLGLWAQRLEQARLQACALVGEQRYRTWLVYLAGCAHAFERAWISLHQILAVKARRDGMAPVRWTRAHVYSVH